VQAGGRTQAIGGAVENKTEEMERKKTQRKETGSKGYIFQRVRELTTTRNKGTLRPRLELERGLKNSHRSAEKGPWDSWERGMVKAQVIKESRASTRGGKAGQLLFSEEEAVEGNGYDCSLRTEQRSRLVNGPDPPSSISDDDKGEVFIQRLKYEKSYRGGKGGGDYHNS